MHHRQPRRRLHAVAASFVAALLALGVAGCGGDDEPSGPATSSDLTLRIGDQGKTLELPLTLSGEDEGAPYKISFNNFADGPNMNAAFSAGKLDVGFMGDTPVLFANAADAGVVAVAVAESTKSAFAIFAREGSGIRTLADLRGRKITLTEGTALHGYLLQQLDSVGLSQDDVTVVNVPVNSLASTFASGQVDAIVYVDQYADVITGQASGAYEIETSPLPQYSVLLAARSALADPEHREAVIDFVLRMSRASTWPKANPDAWVREYYVKQLKQDEASSRAYFDTLPATQYLPVTDEFIESQRRQAELLIGVGKLPSTLKIEDEIDTAFNAELAQRFAAAGITS